MRYLLTLLFLYMVVSVAYAGPDDKWVYVGPSETQGTQETQFDGIALLLAVGAFAWMYIIYKDKIVKVVKER